MRFGPLPHVPFGPLLKALEANGLFTNAAISELSGLSPTTISRGRSTGIVTVGTADEIATKALNVHPTYIYGHDWLTVPDRIDIAFLKLHEAASGMALDHSGLDDVDHEARHDWLTERRDLGRTL